MQEATADAVLHTGKDVVVMSPTGSGKTYAYLLPLIQRLDASSDALQAVVLVPGRELALQSANVLKDMGSGLRVYAFIWWTSNNGRASCIERCKSSDSLCNSRTFKRSS